MIQKHRTDIVLSGYECRGGQNVPLRHSYIKLNNCGYPYIVVADVCFVLSNAKFPMTLRLFGKIIGEIQACSDLDALRAILTAPKKGEDRWFA